MSPRLCLTTLAIFAFLTLLPSCSKKQSSGGGGGEATVTPVSTSTDHVVFVRLDAKALRNGPIFKEVLDAFAKQGERKSFDDLEREIANQINVKLTSVESATLVVPDLPQDDQGSAPLIIIVTTETPIGRQTLFGNPARESSEHAGFYHGPEGMLVHFPEDKIMVVLNPRFVASYKAGYATNRTGWPLSADLMKAAEGHTLFASVSPPKLPAEMRKGADVEKFLAFLESKSAQLTLDIRGKEFTLAIRGDFANTIAATNAKNALDKLLAEAGREIDKLLQSPDTKDNIVFKEARRAVREAKVSVSGNELTASTSYKAEFDVGVVLKSGIDKVREAAARSKAQNNLLQIGMALHNYASANGGEALLISGIGKNGMHFRDPNGKPLLSWRVALLPYMEEENLYRQFKLDEPWDSEHNKTLISRMPRIFHPITRVAEPGMTHIQQIIGPQCFFPGRFNIGNITDGTMNTIAVIEAADPVIWTKPDDVFFPEKDINAPPPKDLKKKFGGLFPNGFNVLMWDGAVRWVDARALSDETLWNAIRPADGKPLGSDWP